MPMALLTEFLPDWPLGWKIVFWILLVPMAVQIVIELLAKTEARLRKRPKPNAGDKDAPAVRTPLSDLVALALAGALGIWLVGVPIELALTDDSTVSVDYDGPVWPAPRVRAAPPRATPWIPGGSTATSGPRGYTNPATPGNQYVRVRGHYRANGTYVPPHWRRRPGATVPAPGNGR